METCNAELLRPNDELSARAKRRSIGSSNPAIVIGLDIIPTSGIMGITTPITYTKRMFSKPK